MTKAELIELKKNPVNVFKCACGAELAHKEFMSHIKEVHHIEVKGLQGKREMIMHMDGDKWFTSDYKWTLQNGAFEFVFHQHTMLARENGFYR